MWRTSYTQATRQSTNHLPPIIRSNSTIAVDGGGENRLIHRPRVFYSGSTVLKKINIFAKIHIMYGIFLSYVIIEVTVFLKDNIVINIILKENDKIMIF